MNGVGANASKKDDGARARLATPLNVRHGKDARDRRRGIVGKSTHRLNEAGHPGWCQASRRHAAPLSCLPRQSCSVLMMNCPDEHRQVTSFSGSWRWKLVGSSLRSYGRGVVAAACIGRVDTIFAARVHASSEKLHISGPGFHASARRSVSLP